MSRCCGHVGAGGRLLTVTVDGRRWTVLIRRIDGACDAALVPFHGRQIYAHRLKTILPCWPRFNWTHHLAPSVGLPCESRAVEPPYQITLIYPQARTLRPCDVIHEFATELVWQDSSGDGKPLGPAADCSRN